MRAVFLVLTCAMLLPACIDQDVTFRDEGRLCLYTESSPDPWGSPSEQRVEAHQAITFQVTLTDCLSGSCTNNREASCEAVLDGNTVRITSQGAYTDNGGLLQGCTSDCHVVSAACSLDEGLPEGEYTVVHGEDVMSLSVASTVAEPCMGEIE